MWARMMTGLAAAGGFLVGFGLARALGTSETGQYALAAATTGLAASGVTLLMDWSL
jgi:hypothetical protein